jgi:hypothetical protein
MSGGPIAPPGSLACKLTEIWVCGKLIRKGGEGSVPQSTGQRHWSEEKSKHVVSYVVPCLSKTEPLQNQVKHQDRKVIFKK